jgi:hypothetical protein
MPICASAARRLLTFADPLSWAVSRVFGLGRSILAQGRAIDGFASTGNSSNALQQRDPTCVPS